MPHPHTGYGRKLVHRAPQPDQEPPIPEKVQKPVSAAPSGPAKPQERRKSCPPRLPDGSTFLANYKSDTQSWTGSLSVPGLQLFFAKCSSVFGLLTKLDRAYRKWLEAQAAK